MSAIGSGRAAGGSQVPVQGGLEDAGLGADRAVALALATSLSNLSVLLAGLGRREEALAAIEEAVTVRRELAARWPDAYEQELMQSLQVVAWLEQNTDVDNASPPEPRRDNGPLYGLPPMSARPIECVG
jgi:hypothetical protein